MLPAATALIATAWRIRPIVRVRCASLRARPSCAPRRAPRRGSGTGRRSAAWACPPAWSSRTRAWRRSRGRRGSAREVSPYCSASVDDALLEARDRDLARLLRRAPALRRRSSPRASAACVDDRFGLLRLRFAPAWSRASSCSSIWSAASLTNVPGPNTTLTVLAARELPARTVRAALGRERAAGTLPDRHPSSPSSRSMSELSTSCCRLPLTSTSTGSSPKLA